MTVMIQTSDVLQLLNTLITHIMGLLSAYGIYAIYFGLLFFAAWLIYELGRLIHDVMQLI